MYTHKDIMMKVALIALIATVVSTPIILAHEGHTHVLMGTVASIAGNRVEMQTTDAKKKVSVVSMMLRDDTVIRRGTTKAAVSDLKVGERIVVDAEQERDLFVARTIRLPVAAKK